MKTALTITCFVIASLVASPVLGWDGDGPVQSPSAPIQKELKSPVQKPTQKGPQLTRVFRLRLGLRTCRNGRCS